MADYVVTVAPFINETFYVTSAQPYYPDGTPHGGFDISTGTNSPVYSMTSGKVLYSEYNTGGYGNCIIIQDQTSGTTILYAHLRDLPLFNVKFITKEEYGWQDFVNYESCDSYEQVYNYHYRIGDNYE